jgi:hypothetical protein
MAPLFDSKTPVTFAFGNNRLGPGGAYKFRKFWKEKGMDTDLVDVSPIDFWYGKLFHGRVDGTGVVVYPSETNFKQVPTNNGETYWAIDFVVDAFAGFQEHMQKALARGLISSEGTEEIRQVNPRRSWVSAHLSYNLWMERLYDHLVTFWFQKQQRNAKIRNFHDFLHEFMELVDDAANIMPFTKSAFILSKYFSPLSSGLVIEISEDSHGTDIVKQKKWVQDSNFSFYRNSAKNFGFVVDKNAPWRLVADVNSAMMGKYMAPYGVTGKDLFETYYYRCHLYDIEALKVYLIEMYNAYVAAYPQAKEFRTKLKGAGGVKTVSRLVDRLPTTIQEVNKQFNPQFWLKTYYYIRLREMGAPRDPVEFNKKLEKIFQANKSLDFERALHYINDNIRRIKVP